MRRFLVTLGIVLAIGCGSSSDNKANKDAANTVDTQVQDTKGDVSNHDVPASDQGTNGSDLTVDQGFPFDYGQTDTNQSSDVGGDTSNGGGTQCPQPSTGKTCAEVGACLMACDKSDYQQQCKDGSTEDAVKAFDAVKQCADENNCEKIFDQEWFTDCMVNNCDDSYKSCFVGSDDSCENIVKCRKDCPAGDVFCPVLCIAKADETAQKEYFDYVKCLFQQDCVIKYGQVNANGWPISSCEQQAIGNCHNQWQACFKPH